MVRLTGGQALARTLVREGVDTIFALPGVQLDWAFDGLYEVRDALKVYHTRHEQTTAYMADGYARTTGKVGVCFVVPGPGVLNAGAALATAYATSSPVLCLTGQIDSRAIDQNYGLLHEVPHQLELLGSFTKWASRAMDPAAVADELHAAFRHLRRGRPRPVAVEIPPDVLQDSGKVHLHSAAKEHRKAGDPDALRRAAKLLQKAERPVIYSGGGVLAAGAWEELRAIAEQLQIPVVMTVNGRGAISERSYLAHTGVSGQQLCEEADLILAVGTRFWQPGRVWSRASGAKVIRIDADKGEVRRTGKATVGIVGDAQLALAALRDLLDGAVGRATWTMSDLSRRKQAAENLLAEYRPQAEYAAVLRAALPDDAIVVNDLTQMTFFASVGLPVYEPRTFIGPGYQGTLGSAYATALGAQAGNPDRKVVVLAGDGGFLYTLGDLATQSLHDLNVVSIVFNDGAFGNVKRIQQEGFGGRMLNVDLKNPDFVRLAESFGIQATRVSSPRGLADALPQALAANAPALIEVQVGEMPSVWSTILPAGGAFPVLLP